MPKQTKIPPYDPSSQTLSAWLEETSRIMQENPKKRAAVLKERAKILAPKDTTLR